ncbi:MAG: hypothetical protein ACRDBO_17585 [Lachnospiraceae bacterium]
MDWYRPRQPRQALFSAPPQRHYWLFWIKKNKSNAKKYFDIAFVFYGRDISSWAVAPGTSEARDGGGGLPSVFAAFAGLLEPLSAEK